MLCPRCTGNVSLAQGFGALTEDVCASCKGRFLSPAIVERLIVDELGISQDVLRELTALFASKERRTCPACESKMSPVQVKKVRVDLCTGCGGAWLDAGELVALTQGRHEELTPTSSDAAPGTPSGASTTPAPIVSIVDDDSVTSTSPSGVVVFFDDPASVTRDLLAAAFAQLPGLANADAMQIAAKQRPTAVEGVSEEHAQAVVAALSAQGIASHIADASWLSLPPPYQTNALATAPDGITLGRADASIGRVHAPWTQISAVAAGQILRSSMKRTPGRALSSTRTANEERDYDLSVVEAADTYVEIVLNGPPRRFRLLLSTMIFGETGRPRPMMLNDRLTALAQAAPSTLPIGRGVRAAVEGRPLPRFSSTRDLERELGWLLWRAYGAR